MFRKNIQVDRVAAQKIEQKSYKSNVPQVQVKKRKDVFCHQFCKDLWEKQI